MYELGHNIVSRATQKKKCNSWTFETIFTFFFASGGLLKNEQIYCDYTTHPVTVNAFTKILCTIVGSKTEVKDKFTSILFYFLCWKTFWSKSLFVHSVKTRWKSVFYFSLPSVEKFGNEKNLPTNELYWKSVEKCEETSKYYSRKDWIENV